MFVRNYIVTNSVSLSLKADMIRILIISILTTTIALAPSSLLNAQSIGYGQVTYVPESETINYNKMPITHAVEDFIDRLRSQLKEDMKPLKSKDENYELIRHEILLKESLYSEASLRAIFEIESLKVLSKEEAFMTLYEFLDCWEDRSFKTRKRNFCMGCWEEHIEKERYNKERFATIY